MKKFILGAFVLTSVFSFSVGSGTVTASDMPPHECQQPCLENPY